MVRIHAGQQKFVMKYLKLLVFLLIIFIILTFIPILFFTDAPLSQEDLQIAHGEARNMLDNPFEQIFVTKIVVDKKEGDIIYTSAYTFGGIKYATVEVTKTGASVRRFTD